MSRLIRLCTRGSPLALVQANKVAAQLQDQGLRVDIVSVTASGDENSSIRAPLRKDAFVKELQTLLLSGSADLAVHSLKDMLITPSDGLCLAAVSERSDVEDVCLLPEEVREMQFLPAGARIGTCSLRRSALAKHHRPDLQIVAVRGNVGTRLKKMQAGDCDALILARAGLMRLGLMHPQYQVLPTKEWLPAPGQGALGLEMANDSPLLPLVKRLECLSSRCCVDAERAFALAMEADCNAPLGALASIEDSQLFLHGFVANRNGDTCLTQSVRGVPERPHELGKELAQWMRARGGLELLRS